MAPLTRAQKSTHSRVGALLMHALNDTQKTSAPGRRAAEARYLRQVLEAAMAKGEELTEAEAYRRADSLKRAFMASIALKSAAARRSRREPSEAQRRASEAQRRASEAFEAAKADVASSRREQA